MMNLWRKKTKVQEYDHLKYAITIDNTAYVGHMGKFVNDVADMGMEVESMVFDRKTTTLLVGMEENKKGLFLKYLTKQGMNKLARVK